MVQCGSGARGIPKGIRGVVDPTFAAGKLLEGIRKKGFEVPNLQE